MTDRKDVGRELRDELLELTAFDPEDAATALFAVKPETAEVDEPEPESEADQPG